MFTSNEKQCHFNILFSSSDIVMNSVFISTLKYDSQTSNFKISRRRLEILKFNYLDCRNTIINCSQRKMLYIMCVHVAFIFSFIHIYVNGAFVLTIFWNCSGNVVYYVLHLIISYKWALILHSLGNLTIFPEFIYFIQRIPFLYRLDTWCDLIAAVSVSLLFSIVFILLTLHISFIFVYRVTSLS